MLTPSARLELAIVFREERDSYVLVENRPLQNMAVGKLDVQTITSFAEVLALAPEWRALETACATDLPFQTWEWATVWWEHLREDGPGVRDSLRVCVVRDESGQVVGIAPLMLTKRPSSGPVRFRFLQFIGADPNVTEIRSMLCLPHIEGECQQAVLQHLANSARQWDWIVWEGLSSDPGAEGAPSGASRSAPATSAFVLALPPTWEDLKDGLGRNIKESLRKCYNSLKRDG